jgi:hypothetical protein
MPYLLEPGRWRSLAESLPCDFPDARLLSPAPELHSLYGDWPVFCVLTERFFQMGYDASAVAGLGIELREGEIRKLSELGLEESDEHSQDFIEAMAEEFPGIAREITECLRLRSVCEGEYSFLMHKDALLRTKASGSFEVESCEASGLARAVSQLEIAGQELSLKGKPKLYVIQDYF